MSTEHWQGVHTTKDINDVSWWQPADALWLDLITENAANTASVIDVGSGSGMLADELLRVGFTDVTCCDISAASLDRIRERLGERVRLLVGDVRDFDAGRGFDVWFDRAVFHFLTEETDIAAYVKTLNRHTKSGAIAIIATFAEDGPEQCSGLPVRRYSQDELATVFTDDWTMLASERRVHITPWDSEQPFSIVVLQRT